MEVRFSQNFSTFNNSRVQFSTIPGLKITAPMSLSQGDKSLTALVPTNCREGVVSAKPCLLVPFVPEYKVGLVLVPTHLESALLLSTGEGCSSLIASSSVEPIQIKPPRTWFRFGRWFRLGIGIVLLLSVLLTSAGCSSTAAPVPWQDATSVMSTPVLQSIVAADTSLDPKTAYKDMQAWVVDGRSAKLVAIDFNNQGLCGSNGCLYSGYLVSKLKPPTRVFSTYLHPDMPPARPLFAVGGDNGNSDLPCIQVNQVEGEMLRQFDYCYNGQDYQASRSRLLDTTSNKSSESTPATVEQPKQNKQKTK